MVSAGDRRAKEPSGSPALTMNASDKPASHAGHNMGKGDPPKADPHSGHDMSVSVVMLALGVGMPSIRVMSRLSHPQKPEMTASYGRQCEGVRFDGFGYPMEYLVWEA